MGIAVPESFGRWIAVLIVVPFLVCIGKILLMNPTQKKCKQIAYCLLVFSFILFVYECLWLMGILWH